MPLNTLGRWGGQILYDQLDKIARGEGARADLDHLKEIGKSMQVTSKCEIGKTVPNPILDLMEHFEDTFLDCIDNQKKSKHYDDSIGYIAKITAPCTDACPSHVDIPGYIEGVRDLRFDDSLEATRQTMPLAHVCGRVCPHPCEDACRRTNLDEPISIMALKRLGADWETDHGYDFFHDSARFCFCISVKSRQKQFNVSVSFAEREPAPKSYAGNTFGCFSFPYDAC